MTSGAVTMWVLLGLAAALVGWRLLAAARVWRDTRVHSFSPLERLVWTGAALFYPASYWWGGRLERLSRVDAQAVLRSAAAAHRLSGVANVRCPLCDVELVDVLLPSRGATPAIRRPARCPNCDFRLDACRHCQHFLPAEDGLAGEKDMTHGRCGLYRAPQPVAEAYPHMAQRLLQMGYETLNAPKPIVDSYQPLDECRSFVPQPDRLRASRLRWLNRQRVALIRLRERQRL